MVVPLHPSREHALPVPAGRTSGRCEAVEFRVLRPVRVHEGAHRAFAVLDGERVELETQLREKAQERVAGVGDAEPVRGRGVGRHSGDVT